MLARRALYLPPRKTLAVVHREFGLSTRNLLELATHTLRKSMADHPVYGAWQEYHERLLGLLEFALKKSG